MNISKINITIKNFPDDNNLDKKLVKYKFDNNKKSCIIEVKEKGFWTWIDRFFNRYFLSHNSYDLKKFSDIILKVQPINEGIEKNLSAITTFVISKLNSETEDENTNYSLNTEEYKDINPKIDNKVNSNNNKNVIIVDDTVKEVAAILNVDISIVQNFGNQIRNLLNPKANVSLHAVYRCFLKKDLSAISDSLKKEPYSLFLPVTPEGNLALFKYFTSFRKDVLKYNDDKQDIENLAESIGIKDMPPLNPGVNIQNDKKVEIDNSKNSIEISKANIKTYLDHFCKGTEIQFEDIWPSLLDALKKDQGNFKHLYTFLEQTFGIDSGIFSHDDRFAFIENVNNLRRLYNLNPIELYEQTLLKRKEEILSAKPISELLEGVSNATIANVLMCSSIGDSVSEISEAFTINLKNVNEIIRRNKAFPEVVERLHVGGIGESVFKGYNFDLLYVVAFDTPPTEDDKKNKTKKLYEYEQSQKKCKAQSTTFNIMKYSGQTAIFKNIDEEFDNIYNAALYELNRGGKICIACQQGKDRSVYTIMKFIGKVYGLDFNRFCFHKSDKDTKEKVIKIFNFINNKRLIATSNDVLSDLKQLIQTEFEYFYHITNPGNLNFDDFNKVYDELKNIDAISAAKGTMLDGINNIDDAMDKVVKDNPLNENFKDFYFKWRQAQKNQTS